MSPERRRRVWPVPALRAIPTCVGHGQLRPALLGWQYRISLHGAAWGPWMFAFGARRRALERLERLTPIWIEEEAR